MLLNVVANVFLIVSSEYRRRRMMHSIAERAGLVTSQKAAEQGWIFEKPG